MKLWKGISLSLSLSERQQLESLFSVPENGHLSAFERLRRAPTRISAGGILEALSRVEEVHSYRASRIDLSSFPKARLRELVRYAHTARSASIAQMTPERKLSTLLVWLQSLEVSAVDDVLDILDQLINRVLMRAQRRGQKERLRSLLLYDKAVLDLIKACETVIQPTIDDDKVREAIFAIVSKEQLSDSVGYAKEVARDNDEYYERLDRNYSTVRQFLPKLLSLISFETTEAGRPVIKALDYLRAREGSRKLKLYDAPKELVSGSWRSLVLNQDGTVSRKYYTFCVLEKLRASLRRRDVFISPSERWGDPRTDLLSESEWVSKKNKICSTLGIEQDIDDSNFQHRGERASYLLSA